MTFSRSQGQGTTRIPSPVPPLLPVSLSPRLRSSSPFPLSPQDANDLVLLSHQQARPGQP